MADPVTLRLTAGALARRDGVLHLLYAKVGRVKAELASAFALTEGERAFARELLRAKPAFWLFRTHQRRFCADFVAIDMASPSPERRRAWAIDLKQSGLLRVGGGGASVAFARVELAIDEIARETDALRTDARVERVTGSASTLLAHLAGGSS